MTNPLPNLLNGIFRILADMSGVAVFGSLTLFLFAASSVFDRNGDAVGGWLTFFAGMIAAFVTGGMVAQWGYDLVDWLEGDEEC